MNNYVIELESLDAAGKHTQALNMKKYISDKYGRTYIQDYPKYDGFFGKLIGKFLRGEFGTVDEVSPELISAIYALDRMEDINKLNYLLEDDTTIIFDRYIYSNIFNAVKTDNPEKFMKWIEELEFDKLKNIKPDYVFYLHVDPSISIMQAENRGKKEFQAGKKDIHETNFNLLAAADKYYIEYANSHDWFIIDEMKDGKQLSKDEVFDLIKEKIDCIYGGIK